MSGTEMSEARFVSDARAPGEFRAVQKELRTLLGDRGPLGLLDRAGRSDNLPPVDLARDRISTFGANKIIEHTDGRTSIYHKGRWFVANRDGTIQGDRPGSTISGMVYDKESKTVKLDNGKVRLVFDPQGDRTTVDYTDPRSRTRLVTEITRDGIAQIKDGKLARFLATDRSYSIDVDPATGRANVKGADGNPMRADHPHKDLLALNGKVPVVGVENGRPYFTIDEGAGERTFYPGSHSTLADAFGDIEEVQYGRRKWTFSDDAPGKTKIKSNDGAEYVVNNADLNIGSDGRFQADLGRGRRLEVDPGKGCEKLINGDNATVKYAEAPGRRPYSAEMSKDGEGKWGYTSITDERGRWTFTYKPPASRDVANLDQISGPGGTFKRDDKVAGFNVGPDGDITVLFKPGRDQKYASSTFSPGRLEEVHKTPDGRNIAVKYERVTGVPPFTRVSEVADGSNVYKPVYYGLPWRDQIQKLVDKDGRTVYERGPNITGITYNPETKGFSIAKRDGRVDINPSRNSRIDTRVDGPKTIATETFGDRATGTERSVVTETVGGKSFLRSFTDTSGTSYKVVYNDDADPARGIKTVLGPGDRPIPEIARFQSAHGLPTIAVSSEGRVTLSNPAGDTTLVKQPDGKTVFSSPTLSETRDKDGLVVETTLPRLGGRRHGGLIIERDPGAEPLRPLRNLTLKDTGESLTHNPRTGMYEYKNPSDPESSGNSRATVVVDANGNVIVNGNNLGRDPRSRDITTALSAAPPDARPPAPLDGRRPAPPDERRPGPADERRPGPADEMRPGPADERIPAPLDRRRPVPEPVLLAMRNKDRFQKIADLPNGGAEYRDGTRVERTRLREGGTVVRTTDGATGTQIVYRLDAGFRLKSLQNPDGTVWTRTANNWGGYSLWASNTGQRSWVRTEGRDVRGRKLGLDEFGCFHYARALQDGSGNWRPVSYACLPNYSNLYEAQFAHFRRTGVVMPMAPPFLMPRNPRFDRGPRRILA